MLCESRKNALSLGSCIQHRQILRLDTLQPRPEDTVTHISMNWGFPRHFCTFGGFAVVIVQ